MGQMVGIRAEALTWWRSLPQETKENLVREHFPDTEFILIDKSSSRIERLYLKIKSENN